MTRFLKGFGRSTEICTEFYESDIIRVQTQIKPNSCLNTNKTHSRDIDETSAMSLIQKCLEHDFRVSILWFLF